jgi:hypothetical protein
VIVDFEVIPPATDDERRVLAGALGGVAHNPVELEPRAMSSWWRAGAQEAVGSADADELEPHAFSPRKTRGATRA